ncbi:MAG: hypothetical protein KC910_33390 [Candidatus Eremiobacteraeota bacterium]|nr:hypothetical protein [Candidatus Eremiobacteraeota bacterium]
MKVDRHTLRGTPANLLTTLDGAAISDKAAESRMWYGGAAAGISCISLFFLWPLGLGAALALSSGKVNFKVFLGLMAVIVPALLVFFGVRYYLTASEEDLDDARLEMLRSLLEHLRHDLPPSKELELTVDFRQTDQAPFLVSGEMALGAFRQTWLVLQGRFLDGTAFKLQVEQLVKKKTKPKRRGNKIKLKTRERLTLDLKASPRVYPPLDGLEQMAGSPPANLAQTRVQTSGHRVKAMLLTRRAGPGGNLASLGISQADTLLSGLVYLYHGMRVLKSKAVPG